MIEVKRKERENSESLVRRFGRKVQQSHRLADARKRRFRPSEKTKDERRAEALYKTRIRKEITRLKKLGKFDNNALREIKKRMN